MVQVIETVQPPPGMADLWLAQYRDCSAEPIGLSPEKAHFLLRVHAGHGPSCRAYLAAAAFQGTVVP